MGTRPAAVGLNSRVAKVFDFSEIQRGPTTWLFEGGPRADAGISMFIVRIRLHESVDQTWLGRDPA